MRKLNQIDEKIYSVLFGRLTKVVLAGAVVSASFAVLHLVVLSGQIRNILFMVALGSCAGHLSLRRYLLSEKFKLKFTPLVAFMTYFLFVINSGSHLYLSREIHQSTNIMMCLSSAGVFFNTFVAGALGIVVSLSIWIITAINFSSDPLFPHYTIGIGVSLVIGIIFLYVQASQSRELAKAQVDNEQKASLAVALSNASSDALIVVINQVIVAINQKMELLLMTREADMRNNPIESLFCEEMHEVVSATMANHSKGQIEIDLLGKGSSKIPVILTYDTRQVGQDRVITISARSAKEEHSKNLTAIDTSLKTLASGIAHEINNPLTIATGYLSLLSTGIQSGKTTPEKLRVAIDSIQHSIVRISKIVSSLLKFATTSDGLLRPVIVHDVVRFAVDFHRQKFSDEGIMLEIEMRQEDEDHLINSRGHDISNIIMALMENSCDSIKQEKIRKITLKVINIGQDVAFQVIDSGPRIPIEVSKNLFLPFYTTKAPGVRTGLSLSLARKSAQEHGGSLEYLSSEPSTTFELRIPLWTGVIKQVS